MKHPDSRRLRSVFGPILACSLLIACGGGGGQSTAAASSGSGSSTSSDASTGAGGAGSTSTSASSGSAGGGGGGAGGGGGSGQGGSAPAGAAPGTSLVSAGQTCKSPSYRMVSSFGQPTQNQGKTSSPSYRMQGGLIGATGSLP